jgi:hypothetical protein
MLTPLKVMSCPDLKQLKVGPKIIKMPVRSPADLAMMLSPCRHTAGAECTPYINIVAGTQNLTSQCPHIHLLFMSAEKNQGIAAGKGFHMIQGK